MNDFLQRIINYQAALQPETIASGAVIVPLLFNQKQTVEIFLTQRSEIFSYPNDICFPGGLKEASDDNLLITGLREFNEELGLALEPNIIIGQLNDFYDNRNRLIRPFVAAIPQNLIDLSSLQLSPEVQKILRLPLSILDDIKIDTQGIKPSRRKPNYIYQQEDVLIWGLTASILVHLANVIFEKNHPIGFTSEIESIPL